MLLALCVDTNTDCFTPLALRMQGKKNGEQHDSGEVLVSMA